MVFLAGRRGLVEVDDRPVRQFGLHRASDRAAFGGEGIEVDFSLEGFLEPGAPASEPRAQLRAERQFGGIERCAVMVPDAGCAVVGHQVEMSARVGWTWFVLIMGLPCRQSCV